VVCRGEIERNLLSLTNEKVMRQYMKQLLVGIVALLSLGFAQAQQRVETSETETWYCLVSDCSALCLTSAYPGSDERFGLKERPSAYDYEIDNVLWRISEDGFLINRAFGKTVLNYKDGYVISSRTKKYVMLDNGYPQYLSDTAIEWGHGKKLKLDMVPVGIEGEMIDDKQSLDNRLVTIWYCLGEGKDDNGELPDVDSSMWFCFEKDGQILTLTNLNSNYGNKYRWSQRPWGSTLVASLWRFSEDGFLINGEVGKTWLRYKGDGNLYDIKIRKFIGNCNGEPRHIDDADRDLAHYQNEVFHILPLATDSEVRGSFKDVENRMKVLCYARETEDYEDIDLKIHNLNSMYGYLAKIEYDNPVDVQQWGEFATVESVVEKGRKSIEAIERGDDYIVENGTGISIEFKKDMLTYANGYHKFKYTTRELRKIPCEDERYGEPYEVCINGPYSYYTVQMSPTKWIIDEQNQIQTVCRHGKDGHPIEPVFEEDELAKLGTYSSTYNLFGIATPCTVTCSRRMYQTPRTNKRTSHGGTVAHTMYGTDGDPFAPWRVVQDRHWVIDVGSLSENAWAPANVLALIAIYNNCGDFVVPQIDKYAFKAALYKTYNLSDTAKLRADMVAAAQKLESKGGYNYYTLAMFLYHMMGDYQNSERLSDMAFRSCTTPEELLFTLERVRNTIMRDNYVDTYKCLFAGLPRFNIEPALQRSAVNALCPNADTTYLKELWPLRDKFFSDYTFFSQFNDKLKEKFVRYMQSGLTANYDHEFYKKMAQCPDISLISTTVAHRDYTLTLELYKIKKELLTIDSIETLQSLVARIDILEGYVNSDKIRLTKDCEPFDFELEKVRARAEFLSQKLKQN